jgi:glycosyltransferase involved in cell wall biosynthesis
VKVVVVASLAYSLINFRGALLARMVANGHEVIACAPDRDAAVEARLAVMGIAYRTTPMARTGLNPLRDLVTLFWLVRLFARARPDIVLAYTQKPIIYAGLACRLAGRARFFAMVSGLGHVYGGEASRRLAMLRRAVSILYRAALVDAGGVFVFNADDRGEMIRHRILPPDAAVVQVPGSGVDPAMFAAQPVPDGPPTFLMIARLMRSKGLCEYVAAAALVRMVAPEARFQLLGPRDVNPSGVDAAQIARWEAEGVVTYLGETRDVRPYLAAASLFVLPSWYREGLPRTILEAMATGRGVITTDMPGCREPIDEGVNGLLVPPHDARALADAMLRFVDARGLARTMGMAARRTVEQRYTVDRVNRILLTTMGLEDVATVSRDAAATVRPVVLPA